MKKFLTILTLAFVALPMLANEKVDDEVTLTDVEASRQNYSFVINYDISLGEDVVSCNIALLLSTDAGQTYSKVDKQRLSGDYGRIKDSGHKTILFDFTQDRQSLANKQLVFKVEVTDKSVNEHKTLIAAEAAVYPHLSYGIMFGRVNKWGWYAKLRSDFCFPTSSYEYISTSGNFWGTGASKISRYNVTVGTMARASNWLYPYVGLGYGRYGLYLQDLNRNWAVVSDYFTAGLSLDAGVVLKLGKVSITAGVSNTMFEYTEAEIGVGFMF